MVVTLTYWAGPQFPRVGQHVVTAGPLLLVATQFTLVPVVAILGLAGGALAVAMPLLGDRIAG